MMSTPTVATVKKERQTDDGCGNTKQRGGTSTTNNHRKNNNNDNNTGTCTKNKNNTSPKKSFRMMNQKNRKQEQEEGKDNHNSTNTSTSSSIVVTTSQKNESSSAVVLLPYPVHKSTYDECLQYYQATTKESISIQMQSCTHTQPMIEEQEQQQPQQHLNLIRGTLKVLPGNYNNSTSFVTCDRGYIVKDVCIPSYYERNRALHKDIVFVQLIQCNHTTTATTNNNSNSNREDDDLESDDNNDNNNKGDLDDELWQEDEQQMDLWNPLIPLKRTKNLGVMMMTNTQTNTNTNTNTNHQWHGRVVFIVPPSSNVPSEIPDQHHPTTNQKERLTPQKAQPVAQVPTSYRTIIGTIHQMPGNNGSYLLNPNNKSLPQFKFSPTIPEQQIQLLLQRAQQEEQKQSSTISGQNINNNNINNINNIKQEDKDTKENGGMQKETNISKSTSTTSKKPIELKQIMVQAQYEFNSWQVHQKWPPCSNLQYVGQSCVLEDEIQALLIENGVLHGDHEAPVVKECYDVVQSGLCDNGTNWKPTSDMYRHRRDFKNYRIFTIDPTTAKDLDDALHITQISENVIEIGVHIADVSFFVDSMKTPLLDQEAIHRSTTVYLVDRTIPMLPRPLCEIACSLNENVERLAFSCVWRMNMDGTLRQKQPVVVDQQKKKSHHNKQEQQELEPDVWYGRSVIKSCARLDYATAQNIIDHPDLPWNDNTSTTHKDYENSKEIEKLWPSSRRPVLGSIHTMEQIAKDVRLMHMVAMARRNLRYTNGSLELSSTKLTFQLDPRDHQTPLLAAPYPIRDSNKLVEEYMLLANYLVAQKLILHCHDRACLRHHPPPSSLGLDGVQSIAQRELNFHLDVSNSQGMQSSLSALAQQCSSANDMIALKCITHLLMTPMQQAKYVAAGSCEPEEWKHFALNIPYYTHFTSPIRRYPDIIVHRLLQEALDYCGKETSSSTNICKKEEENDERHEESTLDNTSNISNNNNNDNNIDKVWDVDRIQKVCDHSNERKMNSKYAQDRCDIIYLALYVRSNPMKNKLGVVVSVGTSVFSVFIPELGVETKVYLEEHKESFRWTNVNVKGGIISDGNNARKLHLQNIQRQVDPTTSTGTSSSTTTTTSSGGGLTTPHVIVWKTLEIQIFTRLMVTIICKDTSPIDIKARLEGPWNH